MRIVFMGTPAFAVPALEALVAAGHDVAAVYTQPPRPAQRGKQPQASVVQQAAERLGLPVRFPVNFKDEADREAFAALGADVAVVAAYGLILPQAILDAPRRGCLNIHASLLPRWRGAAPIQRAILAGDAVTGVTIMQMERGLDTGPMLLTAETPVDAKTAGALTDELAAMGAKLIVEALSRDTLVAKAQPAEGVTYAHKVDKAESALDFTQSAIEVERAVRAFNPAPGAFTLLGQERLRILACDVTDASGEPGVTIDDQLTIACGTGAIRPTLVQRPGKRAMDVAEVLRGFPVPAGTRLG
ncbi:methionyl-tRNA formyltransferase [Sphingosinicella sp.]|jgi:methionyl-tRNA formyltransferase|uniref:methionyl-tRNA formyltransferase n=1 Tax=Sphingosinicella sp. TaxID=1917971 RepID=UPI0017F43F54|nr:methionyl-tRNA formyltransferase [Sphingosinicella sp.]MBA4757043.1 methionyl-tRNA formyltransferase [Sphingosinicella sp.]MEA3538224.1 methionyl-tRNA formyltransferase [Pseudomonadota bacterium]